MTTAVLSPRCGKPVRPTVLNRPRAWYDVAPVCGRPAGHSELGGCMSEEAYQRYCENKRIAKAARRAAAKAAA